MNFRHPRQRDKAYLAFIAQLSCVSCGSRPVECAHVRMAEACLACGGRGFTPWDTHEASDDTPTVPCDECDMTGYRFSKRPTGMSEKPDDNPWTIPLCPLHHRLGQNSQHLSGNERRFYQVMNIDVLALCVELQKAYPDAEAGEQIIREAHETSRCD